jgi:hypothetical protein
VSAPGHRTEGRGRQRPTSPAGETPTTPAAVRPQHNCHATHATRGGTRHRCRRCVCNHHPGGVRGTAAQGRPRAAPCGWGSPALRTIAGAVLALGQQRRGGALSSVSHGRSGLACRVRWSRGVSSKGRWRPAARNTDARPAPSQPSSAPTVASGRTAGVKRTRERGLSGGGSSHRLGARRAALSRKASLCRDGPHSSATRTCTQRRMAPAQRDENSQPPRNEPRLRSASVENATVAWTSRGPLQSASHRRHSAMEGSGVCKTCV